MPPKDRQDITPKPAEQTDPFMALKVLMDSILERQNELFVMVSNLQETWNRLLNISKEEALRPPPQTLQPPPYNPYAQQPQFVQPIGQEPAPVVDDRPKWEKAKEEDKPKKRRPSKGLMLIFAAVVLLLLVWMFLSSRGYTISLPGM